ALVVEAVGEQLPKIGGEIGLTAFHFGADGAEVDEPVLEQGTGHGLNGLVAAAVEFDLVVQRAEDVGDGALFGEWWQRAFHDTECIACNRVKYTAMRYLLHV